MEWKKASEGLPKRMKYVNGKVQGRPAIVCNSELIKGYITANGNLEPVNLVEWLDESETPPAHSGEELESEVKRLKILICKMFFDNLHHNRDIDPDIANECYQDFKTENNL